MNLPDLSRSTEEILTTHPHDPLREYRSEVSIEEVKGVLMTGTLLGLLQTLMDDVDPPNAAETDRIQAD